MRLISFQDKELLDEVLENGSAQQKRHYYSWVKEEDKELVAEFCKRPIYCYVHFGQDDLTLPGNLALHWSHLMGYMRFARTNNLVLLELDVPEEEIFNIKSVERPWEQPYPIFTVDQIGSKEYNQVVKEFGDMECCLTHLEKDWVVGYHPVKHDSCYGDATLTTVHLDHAKTLNFEGTLGVSGDCSEYFVQDGKLIRAQNREVWSDFYSQDWQVGIGIQKAHSISYQCSECNKTYSLTGRLPEEVRCYKCGGQLVTREMESF